MNKIALITGCSGMDAKTMTHFLLAKNYKVILTYRRNAHLHLPDIANLFQNELIKYPESNLDFIFMEITDMSSIRLAIKSILENPKYGRIDELYNFAAQSHVKLSFDNPSYTMQASGISMFSILESVKEYTPKTKVFQACTSEMFGGNPKNCPFDENSPFESRSPYAVAKAIAYDWIKYFRQTHGIFCCAAFCFNHSNIYRHPLFYIQKCCLSATSIALGKEKELVLGNLDFARDESYSDFCIEAFWKMLQLNSPEDFVIGRGESFTGIEFLEEAFSVYNLKWQDYVKQDKSFFRDNEVVRLLANSTKAKKLLNWNPTRITFKQHIKLMCDYNHDKLTNKHHIRQDVLSLFPNPLDNFTKLV